MKSLSLKRRWIVKVLRIEDSPLLIDRAIETRLSEFMNQMESEDLDILHVVPYYRNDDRSWTYTLFCTITTK